MFKQKCLPARREGKANFFNVKINGGLLFLLYLTNAQEVKLRIECRKPADNERFFRYRP